MNIGALLQASWHITWRNWRLWLLNLLMFAAFVPAALLVVGLTSLSATLSLPWSLAEPGWLTELRQSPGWVWIAVAAGGLALIVATTGVAWTLQAAAMRGAALAAERSAPGGPAFSLAEALGLGRHRSTSILKLSLTFGLIIAAITLVPPIMLVALARQLGGGAALVHSLQAALGPFNALLGLALLLVLMAVALEDLSPGAAFRRAWSVFRTAWWGFVLVVGLSALPAIAVAVLVFPLAAAVVAAMIMDLGWWLPLACTLVVAPLAIGVMLFGAVYTGVMYTLVYRTTVSSS